MREHLVRSLMVGHDLRDYVLLGYGGGYPWKAVATVPHAGASVCITARKQDELDAALRRPPDGQGNVRVQLDGSSV